jgi:hypothetical protein
MLRFVSPFLPLGHNDYVRSHICKCSISNFVIIANFRAKRRQEQNFFCTDNEKESLTQNFEHEAPGADWKCFYGE